MKASEKRPTSGSWPMRSNHSGKSPIDVVLHDDPRRAAEADQPRKRDDERGQAHERDEGALQEAGGRSGEDGDHDCHLERDSTRIVQPGKHAGAEAHDRRDRQVDLAVDDHEGHDHDDDDLLDGELEHVHEVLLSEVEGRERDVHEEDGEEDRRQEQLPAPAENAVTHQPPLLAPVGRPLKAHVSNARPGGDRAACRGGSRRRRR